MVTGTRSKMCRTTGCWSLNDRPRFNVTKRWVSVVTGDGVAGLLDVLAARVTEALGREEAPVLTRVRHRRLVEEARAALDRAIPMLSRGPELAAEDVRVATHAIGRLTGRIDVEDLLDEIFSSFCIGK